MKIKCNSKKELSLLMAAGCLLGILCFVFIYGIKIINPLYDSWIFFGDNDLKQHYVGFCHLRNAAWSFPIGIIRSLSVPYDMSVIYTDSIPLFALIFKVFSGVLPVHFQYFGLFGLMSFALMGGTSAILIRRFTERLEVCLAGSILFIVSIPLLHRMFYHTALTAQWIIIVALIFWFYIDINDKNNVKRLCIIWALMGALCVSIHSYYVFMTGIILGIQILEGIVKERKLQIKHVLPVVAFGLSVIVSLWLLGGFYGAGEVTTGGFSDFNGNLNCLINPMDYSRFFGELPFNGMFEYEGFGYIGFGVILLLIAALVSFVRELVSEKSDGKSVKEFVKAKISVRKVFVILTVMISVILTCFPNFSFNDKLLFRVPLPGPVKQLLGVCRTNGRFVWIALYVVILCAINFVCKHYDKTWIRVLFFAAIIIQLFEFSGKLSETHNRYNAEYSYYTVWDDMDRLKFFDGKEELLFMYEGGDLMMDAGFFTYTHDMNMNYFYYARPIYETLNEKVAESYAEFMNSNINDNYVYLFKDEQYTDELKNVIEKNGLTEYYFDGHFIVTK